MSESVARACGITYRQLDYWVRRGWVRPEEPLPGQGRPREWPAAELNIARQMGLLIAAGFNAEAAHQVARDGRALDVLGALRPKEGAA
jgi:DNA-binding transcriptional MerR regulator